MNPFEMILGIVLICTTGGVLTEFAKAIGRRGSKGGREVQEILRELRALRTDVNTLQSERGGGGRPVPAGDVAARLDQIQQEIAALRDTSTQFDMSFDAALDRLERRVERVEGQRPISPVAQPEEPQILGRR